MSARNLKKLSDTIFVDLSTREVFDKEFGYGAEAITQKDVDESLKLAIDLRINPPRFVKVFNAIKSSDDIDIELLKSYC